MSFHLAGVIPVAGQKLDFDMPWHDALMPLAPNYLAIERCVVECAYAGCETIWVVCADDMQPLIRHRLGESVQDPVWITRQYEHNRKDFQKPIQIYYVPINPKDVNKRDCLSWSVLHGASISHKISSGLSKWLTPSKFYVSWPYGYYPPSYVRQYRDIISSKENVMLSYQGQTVSDGEYLGFTFGVNELNKLLGEVREKSTGLWKSSGSSRERLPLQERFSYRFFGLSDVFDTLNVADSNLIEINKYWKLDNWHDYCKFISEAAEQIKKPSKHVLSYKEWNGIGVDDKK